MCSRSDCYYNPEAVFYHQVQPKHAKKIVSDHLINGKLVEKLFYDDSDTKEIINKLMDTPFYHKQKRVALRNWWTDQPGKNRRIFRLRWLSSFSYCCK